MLIKGPFNIRVYGLCLNEGDIWLSEEHSDKYHFVKFPGGGLMPGEGLTDCLKREWLEETGCVVKAHSFYYVNEFCQISAFAPDQQIFSFYYTLDSPMPDTDIFHKEIRWNQEFSVRVFKTKLMDLRQEDLSFPIDKIVLAKLQEDYRNK